MNWKKIKQDLREDWQAVFWWSAAFWSVYLSIWWAIGEPGLF